MTERIILKDEIVIEGPMKELAGGDPICFKRSLMNGTSDELPQFRLVLTCNTAPSISSNDNGPNFYIFKREESKTDEVD